jgi:protein-S-isoprenylcysteine O-methyltransferase Ste14
MIILLWPGNHEMPTRISFWIFLVLVTARNLAELFIRPAGLRRAPRDAVGRFSLFVLTAGFFLTEVAVAAALYRDGGGVTLKIVIGSLLVLSGFCGRVAGIRRMGASYHQLIRQPAGGLVTDGVYSVVRHPLYLFFAMEMTGFLIIRPNFVSLAALILVLAAVMYRIRREDALLAETFGASFEEYRRKTRAFIPYIL